MKRKRWEDWFTTSTHPHRTIRKDLRCEKRVGCPRIPTPAAQSFGESGSNSASAWRAASFSASFFLRPVPVAIR